MREANSQLRLLEHGVTAIPKGWRLSKVKYLADYINGYPFKPDDWGDIGKPILRIQNLSDTTGITNKFGGTLSEDYLVRAGNLLISWSASLGVYEWQGEDAWLNQHIFKVDLNVDQVVKSYFKWLAEWFIAELAKDAHGSTMQHLTKDAFGSFPLILASQTVQTALADFLNHETARLDSLISAKENLLNLLAEKRRALITSAVTRGINPKVKFKNSGITWLGEIPEHWEIERAKWLFVQSDLPVRDSDEIVTCFRDGQVTLRKNRREEGFTNAVKELGYQGIRQGHLILHSMDAFAGAIGVSDSDGKCSPEYIICDPTTNKTLNYYYGYLLRVMALNGFIQASCPAVRERAPRIRFNDFADMLLPIPPYAEQQQIVEKIQKETAKLDALKEATERTIALLRERRTALIAAAVTGKIAVKESTT